MLSIKRIGIFLIFPIILFVSGCLSQIISIEEYTKQGIGMPIEEIKKVVERPQSYASRIGWKEKTYQLGNGNWVYIEPDSKYCFIHWEVNPKGIIIGYKLEGNCH
ncbi:MAG: hypothetical protein WBJ16_06735 [Smithellaceae bacterium]